MFFSVIISSPKKYQVNGIKIRYPRPNAINLIEKRDKSDSYNFSTPFAKRREMIGEITIAKMIILLLKVSGKIFMFDWNQDRI